MIYIKKCFLVILVLVCSCTNSNTKYIGRIGMTCMDLTNPFFKLIANVMEEEALKKGFQLVALSGDQDPAKQNNQIIDFAVQGYDAIFLNPVDSKSSGEGVKKAYSLGVPVFTFDVQVTDKEAASLIFSHIGSDNYQGGQLAAKSMMKVTGDIGDIAVLSLPRITSCKLRVDGFRDYLKQNNSRIRIVTELSGEGSRDEGFRVATDILQAYPDIVGIFAINDPSALGAYSAVKKAGKSEQIKIVGFDASPAGKQAVFEKQIVDSPQQFPRKMAVGTVNAFFEYLDGNSLFKNSFIPCEHYYHDNSINDKSRINEEW